MKIMIIVGTICVEALLILFVSYLVGLQFIEIMFLGGLAIFGITWMFQMNSVQSTNYVTGYNKGITGRGGGEISVFNFKLSPIKMGMLLYVIMSALVTMFYYKDFFI